MSTGHHDSLTELEAVKPPDEKSFGRTFAVVFLLLAGLMLWRVHIALAIVFAVAAAVFLGAGYLFPAVLRPLNLLWFRFGLVLHKVVNPIIMGALFFAVFTPMGVLMRALGKDFLRIRKTSSQSSHWIVRTQENSPQTSMTAQF